ncbi:MAG: PKD domain-containing protein [Ferruginibacter sp.]
MNRLTTIVFCTHYARFLIAWLLPVISFNPAAAQCPVNIDFENGTFSGWTLYTGSVAAPGGSNQITLSAIGAADPSRHAMLSIPPGNGLDPYGQFPKNCPNGSGHSIKLGSTDSGAEAEGASYEFTIPATSNQFTLTYYYAVVFQAPGHPDFQQPRMEVEVLANGVPIPCSSFSYVSGGALPGFFPSPSNPAILCRDWSANSIKLDGMAGATIKIFFKTTDCTLGGHFGYAYIDVDAKCNSFFPGASFCPGDTSIDVSAPIGYQQYSWHFQGSTQVLGTQQSVHIAPAPPAGTVLLVDVQPYAGYGCSGTFTITLTQDLIVTANAGPDKTSCSTGPVQIGVAPTPGIVYKWTPAAGLSNPNISNPFADAGSSNIYYLEAKSPGGGCVELDTVNVYGVQLDNSLTLTGSTTYCIGSGQSSILKVQPADSIQWYRDDVPIAGANQPQYTVLQSGSYKATVFSFIGNGCNKTTEIKRMDVYPTPLAVASVNNAVQCLPGNVFDVMGSGSGAPGALVYNWNFGDGSVSSTPVTTHSYTAPQLYNIKFTVTGEGGCTDDTLIAVIVKPGAFADFSASSVCIDLPVPIINNTTSPGTTTVNYLWEFGNGETSAAPNPVVAYPVPGNYTIKLSASTPQCPQPTVKEVQVMAAAPAPGIRYPDQPVIINYPEVLHARAIGAYVLWAFVNDNVRSYNPTFTGSLPQEYTIKLTTALGCVTVDTLLVKPYKKIDINVPSVFTPNGDGKNDLLRPLLYGFKKLNYFQVYNRWGKLVFNTTTINAGWDGRVNGAQQDIQTVVWIISAEDVDGKVHVEKGSSVIIR